MVYGKYWRIVHGVLTNDIQTGRSHPAGPNLQFPQRIIRFAIDEVQQIFDAARFRALSGAGWSQPKALPSKCVLEKW